MKWYSYVICFLLIIAGIVSGLNLSSIWSQESKVVGIPITIESQNNFEQLCKFDESLMFETEDYVNYVSITNYSHYDFDGASNSYSLLFNDNLVDSAEFGAGEIKVTITINFYSTTGELASVVDLNVDVLFYEDNTQVTITTINENNSYAYLTRFILNNGFVLKVVERSN